MEHQEENGVGGEAENLPNENDQPPIENNENMQENVAEIEARSIELKHAILEYLRQARELEQRGNEQQKRWRTLLGRRDQEVILWNAEHSRDHPNAMVISSIRRRIERYSDAVLHCEQYTNLLSGQLEDVLRRAEDLIDQYTESLAREIALVRGGIEELNPQNLQNSLN